MSSSASTSDPLGEASREEILSALFADLVMRQSSTALTFLGQIPLPDGSKAPVDLEAAQMFIDQLEMIEVKTRGNLSQAEQQLLRQSLTQLRMAFVKVSEQPPEKPPTDRPEGARSAPPANPSPTPPSQSTGPGPAPASDEGPKARFSKKY